MANGLQNQEGVPENLKRQLAVAARSVQWSYAIFWSLSTRQQGVLEWGDGYYNGDIKTRKAFQALEIKADRTGLQRSEQLRELYECLLDGETDQEAKGPFAALSPDDLTDAEWYYLVCMSFVFNPGQGLPGRALANNQPIWLCNAHRADSKVFSRSLLAKSASVQTVICFPHLGGVIELGVTELVLEDPSLIQHIKASLLEFSKPVCSEKSSSAPHERDNDTDCMYAKVDHETANEMALENYYSPKEGFGLDQSGEGNLQDDFNVDTPDDCSNGCEHNHQTEDPFLVEGSNGGASQAQSFHFMDDDFSNCVQDSINSSDCISQVFVNQGKAVSPPMGENMSSSHLKEIQESNHTNLPTLDLGIKKDDLHYRRTLSAVLRNSHRVLDSHFRSCHYKSSFVSWKKGERVTSHGPRVQQEMLKKMLGSVPLVQAFPDERIKDENEKFMVLKSMVPSISKIDKESILGGTIEYLKELKATIEELESSVYSVGHEANRRKYADVVERSSDNYENGRIQSRKKPWINKRKASDIDETEPEPNSAVPKEGPQLDMEVKIKEQEVLIAMRCPWREHLTLHIVDAMNNLNLEPQSVQSSIVDSILTVSLELKFRGAAVASATTIKQALSAIAGKS